MSLRVPSRVDSTHRYLLASDGRRVFPLADTAWELFHRLTPEEAEHFIRVRAAQGYDAIQCVLLAEVDGLNEPAMTGERPLEGNDPTRPNEAYFAHCDRLVRHMNALGITAVLLPTWGDKVTPMWGAGPAVFTPENARIYGRFLGERYKDAGVFWMIGGDRPVRENTPDLEVWRNIALGIKDAGDTHLMTFHPAGGHSSSEYVHAEAWLDVNSMQTGHTGHDIHIEAMIRKDFGLAPVKPTFDSEPLYEAHPVMRTDAGWRPQGRYFDDGDARNAAYRSLFSGACAHTYGCHAVWQMYDPQRLRMNGPINYPPDPWHQSIHLPGARQMRHAKAFMESEPDWAPFEYGEKNNNHLPALHAPTSKRRALYLLAQLPGSYRRGHVKRFLTHAPASHVSWFDPRTGDSLVLDRWTEMDTPDPSVDWVLDVRA